ncbi:MAG: hypothetical protein WAW61_09995 [Methylococcaceae bacterium]
MLNNEKKKKALAEHEKAVEQYNCLVKTVEAECERLYQTRKQTVELIQYIEDFLKRITNTPHQFEPNFQRIKIEYTKFRHTEDYVAAEAKKEDVILRFGVAAGMKGGMAFAQMAPDAAMWIATTFGNASTGTPISRLSGAAQNKAALAWLGGGAKAIGGRGIAAGQGRLASAVPVIGFSIACVVIAMGTLFALDQENRATTEQAHKETNEATNAGEKLSEIRTAISLIHSETEALLGRVSEQFKSMEPLKDSNYADLSNDEQLQLESLVNNTIALAEMLNKVVE